MLQGGGLGHAVGRRIWACCREDLNLLQGGGVGCAVVRRSWACCRENFTAHSDWEVLMEE